MAQQTPYGFKTFYTMRRFLIGLFLWIGLAIQSQAQSHVGFNKVYSFYNDSMMKSSCMNTVLLYDSNTQKIFMNINSIPLGPNTQHIRFEDAMVRLGLEGNVELMKIDTTLNFSSTYYSVINSADGQFLYWGGGGFEISDTTLSRWKLTKTDKDLNIIWQYYYPTNLLEAAIVKMATIPNSSDILVLGTKYTPDNNWRGLPTVPPRIYICRIDSSGTILSEISPGPTNYNNPGALAIMDNGNYLVSGRTFSWGVSRKGYSLISDPSGTMLSHQLYGLDINSMWILDMKRAHTQAESYYTTGQLCYDEAYTDCPGFVNRIDEQGVELWQKRLTYPAHSEGFWHIAALKNGNAVFSGASRNQATNRDIGWVVQLDSMGNERFNRLYTHAANTDRHEYLYSIVALPDGSFIAGGSSGAPDPLNPQGTNQKAWLIRIDSAGCTTPNCIGDITAIQAPQLEDADAVQLYPNPAHTQTTVRYARGFAKGAHIKVWDALGKLVQSLQLPEWQQEYTIDLNNLTPQLYVLQVQSGNVLQNLKLLVLP
jgi:hypothetical protein